MGRVKKEFLYNELSALPSLRPFVPNWQSVGFDIEAGVISAGYGNYATFYDGSFWPQLGK
jgi:hypothetical protein